MGANTVPELKLESYDIELEIVETDLSNRLDSLYESADLKDHTPFGKIRLFGEGQVPCVYTPDGWREVKISMTEACGDSMGDGEDDVKSDAEKRLAMIKDAKNAKFGKKVKK